MGWVEPAPRGAESVCRNSLILLALLGADNECGLGAGVASVRGGVALACVMGSLGAALVLQLS